MTVDTIRARIADIGATITGITYAHAGMPRNLSAAQLPAMLVFTGPAQREQRDNVLTTNRAFRVVVVVKAWSTGIEYEAEDLCGPFFDRVEEAFFTRPSLQLTDNTSCLAGVQDVAITTDTGVINIALADVGYAGIEFELQVQSMRVLTRGH